MNHTPAPQTETDTATDAINVLKNRWPDAAPQIAVVLGSGWTRFIDHITDPETIEYRDLPGFPLPTVHGHTSELIWGRIGATEVAVLTGRTHAYESGRIDGMRPALETLHRWGSTVLVQTNAAGSLQRQMPPGSLMVISDHLNLSQSSPLTGELGNERFVDMTNAYDNVLREHAAMVATANGTELHEGVYVWFKGPQFETPAEINMFAQLGADAVGMSTVPETIIARHLGMRVAAFSLITNMAAGLPGAVLSHEHTLEQAREASERAGTLLAKIIAEVPQ